MKCHPLLPSNSVLGLHFGQDQRWKQPENLMWYQVRAEAQPEAPRGRPRWAVTWRCEEGAHVPSAPLHLSGPLLARSSPGTGYKSPKPSSAPPCIPFVSRLKVLTQQLPSQARALPRPWGPPAADSIWQLGSGSGGARFAPKQRNIISAKAISTLGETSQSHPPFECKGLAHSSAERGRERKGGSKRKGGEGGSSDRHFGFPQRKAGPVQ